MTSCRNAFLQGTKQNTRNLAIAAKIISGHNKKCLGGQNDPYLCKYIRFEFPVEGVIYPCDAKDVLSGKMSLSVRTFKLIFSVKPYFPSSTMFDLCLRGIYFILYQATSKAILKTWNFWPMSPQKQVPTFKSITYILQHYLSFNKFISSISVTLFINI